jgi:hypothetical protein
VPGCGSKEVGEFQESRGHELNHAPTFRALPAASPVKLRRLHRSQSRLAGPEDGKELWQRRQERTRWF